MGDLISKFLPRLWSNWISLVGTVLTTASGITLAMQLVADVGAGRNPYSAAFMLLVMPAIFVLGLLLIPFGLWIERRGRRTAAESPVEAAVGSLMKDTSTRNRILIVLVATAVNVVLFGVGTQRAVEHMDSPQFCGATCHTVMQPEYDAYRDAKHSRVPCVECHIGPGTSWFVRSKINGLRQVWGVMTGDYHRPVPSPVEHLRPSRDTCEQCHWPEKFTGNKLRVYPHFKDDKDNSPAYNAQMLRVGGRNLTTGKYEGIHWHVSADRAVQFEVLDEKRLQIGRITVVDKAAGDKPIAEYERLAKDKDKKALSVRTMDCIDCHNRATHVFDLGPSFAVDRAIATGELDKGIPWLVKVSRELLARTDFSREGTQAALRKALEEAYAKEYPDVKLTGEQLDHTAKALADLWLHNNYPAMKLTWGTHKTHVGHRGEGDEVIGCFRCHDGEREKKLPDGTTQSLSQDCELCHEPLANEEDPAKFDESLKAMVGVKE